MFNIIQNTTFVVGFCMKCRRIAYGDKVWIRVEGENPERQKTLFERVQITPPEQALGVC